MAEGRVDDVVLHTSCGHEARAHVVKSKGKHHGKFEVRISGPSVLHGFGVHRLHTDPNQSAVEVALSKFLRNSLASYKNMSTSLPGVRLSVNGKDLGSVSVGYALSSSRAEAVPNEEQRADFPLSTPNEEQRAIIDLVVKQRQTCFITGAAGTGKSIVLKHIEQELSRICTLGTVHLTASTGIAAQNIGGRTLHSFAGIGLGEVPRDMLIKRALASAGQRWHDAECLIIDEVSMISGELIDILDQVARAARRKREVPFGGLQLVFCGDFCQLGPRKSEGPKLYAFEATAWDQTVQHHVCLKKVHRQEGDNLFVDLLEQFRVGRVSPAAVDAMSKCTRVLPVENGVLPTKLYCTNRNVDVENANELRKLQGPIHVYSAFDRGTSNSTESFPKNCSALKELELKIGAQVVLIKNIDAQLVNGSRGVVQAFSDGGLPVVAFNNGTQKEIPPVKWTGEGKTFREQVPLRLAWALTVHRCQGMTLDKVECSLADAFAPGQAYVALSRIRSRAGLQLHSFDSSKVIISPTVAAFYSSSRFTPFPATPRRRKEPSQASDGQASVVKRAKTLSMMKSVVVDQKKHLADPAELCAMCGHDANVILRCCNKHVCRTCRESRENCWFCDAAPRQK